MRFYTAIVMENVPRHQCLIYHGAPSQQLSALAATIQEKLRRNYRCLYLNSAPMVAGMRSALWAAGVDVAAEIAKGSLVCSSDRPHLIDDRFDPECMIRLLEDALHTALRDGYAGLWATGDMTWEMGKDQDFQKLVEYEWRLEKFFQSHPQLAGICQYHADTLPRHVLRQGLVAHPGIFVSETLQMVNPEFVSVERLAAAMAQSQRADSALDRLCGSAR